MKDARPFRVYLRNKVQSAGWHASLSKTTTILLRERADRPPFTGLFKFGGLTWEYEVYRLWKMPPEQLLAGPPVIKSLAPLSAVTAKQMPGLIRDMRAELGVLPFQEQRDLWGLADILMGMKYKKEYAHEQLTGMELYHRIKKR